jgi:hypothetical protein
MSQISATDDLRLRRQRLEAAQHVSRGRSAPMAIRQRLAAMQPGHAAVLGWRSARAGSDRHTVAHPPSRSVSLASLLPRPSLASVDWRA